MIDQLTIAYNAIGIVSVMAILIYCLIQVFSPHIREGLLGCIFYLAVSTSSVAWLIHMFQGTYPHRTTITMFFCLACLMIRRLVLSSATWMRFRSWYFLKAKEAKAHNRSK